MTTADWYASEGGQTYGPVTRGEIDAWVREGNLTTAALVWHETLGDWQPISSVFPPAAESDISEQVPAEDVVEEFAPADTPSQEASPPDFFCEKHPDQPSEGICAGCKKDFCGSCLEPINGKFFCPDCKTTAPKEKKKGFFSGLFSKKIIIGILFLSQSMTTHATVHVSRIIHTGYTSKINNPFSRKKIVSSMKISPGTEISLLTHAEILIEDNFFALSAKNEAKLTRTQRVYLLKSGDFKIHVEPPQVFLRKKKKNS